MIRLISISSPRKANGPVEMVEGELLGADDDGVLMPSVAGPVGTEREAVDGPSKRRPVLPRTRTFCPEKAANNGVDPQFFPEPAENGTRPYLSSPRPSRSLFSDSTSSAFSERAREGAADERSPPGPWPRSDIHAPYRGDYALDGLFVLPAVLDDLEVLIGACLLDSCEHGRLLLTPTVYKYASFMSS